MNMIRRCVIAGFAITAMMLCSSSVRASNIYGETTFANGTNVYGSGNVNFATQAGSFTTSLANNSSGTGAVAYASYCVDLFHTTNPSGYKVLDQTTGGPGQLPTVSAFTSGSTDVTSNSAFALAGFGRAAWLVDTYGAGATTSDERAALQEAVWKVEYSSSGDHATTLASGTEQITGETTAQQTQANIWLAADVTAGGGSAYATASAQWVDFNSFSGNHVQDQVLADGSVTTQSTTPEPSTLAIGGLGALAFIGYGLRRRKALGA